MLGVHLNRMMEKNSLEEWHLSPELKEVKQLGMWISQLLNLSPVDTMG